MSELEDQINAIESAIAKGALTLKMGEEQVTYRSLAEMRSIAAELKARRGTGASRQHYPQFVERPR